MTPSHKPRALVAGNWKMNGLLSAKGELDALMVAVSDAPANCDVLICPPATLVAGFAAAAQTSDISIGGQDCHMNTSGAHTGDISAGMLADCGADYVIVGHSERRTDHGETDTTVNAKALAANAAGLIPIICVGETEAQRDAGAALDVIASQLRGSVPNGWSAAQFVVAYEPVWAIGTGRTPSTEDVAEAHAHMRATLAAIANDADGVRLLYGGSVKPGNAKDLMSVANVNGALVGGASLKAADFDGIIGAYR